MSLVRFVIPLMPLYQKEPAGFAEYGNVAPPNNMLLQNRIPPLIQSRHIHTDQTRAVVCNRLGFKVQPSPIKYHPFIKTFPCVLILFLNPMHVCVAFVSLSFSSSLILTRCHSRWCPIALFLVFVVGLFSTELYEYICVWISNNFYFFLVKSNKIGRCACQFPELEYYLLVISFLFCVCLNSWDRAWWYGSLRSCRDATEVKQ